MSGCGPHLLHHMRSCFLQHFYIHPDDNKKETLCGLKHSFILFFFKQNKLPKTWLLAWAAITGTAHYDTHPSLPHTK